MALIRDGVGEKASEWSHTLELLSTVPPLALPPNLPFAKSLHLKLHDNCFGSTHRFAAQNLQKTRTNLDFCINVHAVADICGDGGCSRGCVGGRPETTNTHSPASHFDQLHQWKGLRVCTHEHMASPRALTGYDSLLIFKMV